MFDADKEDSCNRVWFGAYYLGLIGRLSVIICFQPEGFLTQGFFKETPETIAVVPD